LTLPEVILYNSVDAPTRQAVFPQYTHPCAKEAYAEIADELGLSGNTLEEKVKALHDKIVEIRARLKMPATLQETGKVPLADFEAQSYVIAREAFDDQCTLSNPRYPLIKELEALLHNMYHGPSK
jgi:acetaldehyde dehydrogenase/alcohol dehydrogenase